MHRIFLIAAMLVVAPLSIALSEVAIATTEITATVEGFHRALGSGDASAAMERLEPDALVIESGTVQTRAEYERDHLPDDVAFARAVPNKRSALTIQQEGTVAWVSSTSEIVGSFKGKPINSRGAELMVLTQTPAGWRIRAIHWSDHAVRPKK